MPRPAPSEPVADTVIVPGTVRFPVELTPPDGFDPARPETWPAVEGRLEWVEGRLLYMPPCGERQQYTTADLVTVLGLWVRGHPDFLVGTNEAGMLLGNDARGAEGAIWRRADIGRIDDGFARVPPVLAAEVAGRDEGHTKLREKARWYLARGVTVVWLLFPREREVIVATRAGERTYRRGERLAADPSLPDLAASVDELFAQIAAGDV